MKRPHRTRWLSVVRHRATRLAALAAGLLALGAFAAVPAVAHHGPRGDWPAPSEPSSTRDESGTSASSAATAASSTVNFRQNALFTCFGAGNTGTPTANTATITAGPTTITAVVTVHAPAGTMVSGQLTQSGCARLKFFSFTVPASRMATVTITDLRISRNAFVWFNDTARDFQITPEVVF